MGPIKLSRRSLLQYAPVLATATVSGCSCIPKPTPGVCAGDSLWQRFLIARPESRLCMWVTAKGFELVKCRGGYILAPAYAECDRLLIFETTPQHFSETTIGLDELPNANRDLKPQVLFASGPSQLVFRVPNAIASVALTPEGLLDWDKFELVLPDLQAIDDENIAAGRRHALGLDWAHGKYRDTTRIELPSGILLQPLPGLEGKSRWRQQSGPTHQGDRKEIWHMLLENRGGSHLPTQFEVLDVLGLDYEGYQPGDPKNNVPPTARYRNSADYPLAEESSPVTNFDRLDIISSLSRRFKYSDQTKLLYEEQEKKEKEEKDGVCTVTRNTCFKPGRSIEVFTYGLSSLGGWLDLKTEWNADPGCALTAWTHNSTLGRDHFVKIERKGWLYPLGVPAILVIQSERMFMRDRSGHFVAPLVKQAFIQIPQPNAVLPGHIELPFASISVVTLRSGPLDRPPSGGDVSLWPQCAYFMPMVGGMPFQFALSCTDRRGVEIRAQMPCFFVSNEILNKGDGLIDEPGVPPTAYVPPDACGAADAGCAKVLPAVTDLHSNGGLWHIDADWLSHPYRFVKFESQLVEVSRIQSPGASAVEVVWVEMVRGKRPVASSGKIADNPFVPRARTMKIALKSARHFSGQKSYLLATYRNLQFAKWPVLDPLPTDQRCYYSNVFDPLSTDSDGAPANSDGVYLQILPLPGVKGDPGTAMPADREARAIARDTDERIAKISEIYYSFNNVQPDAALQKTLFSGLDNEIRFGYDSNTEAIGGLGSPDTPIGLLSLKYGFIGDSTFAPGAPAAPKDRLDYIYFRLNGNAARTTPYDSYGSCPSNTNEVAEKALVNGSDISQGSAVTRIAQLFGPTAELLPGISLRDIFGGQSLSGSATQPIVWNYKINGPEALLSLIGAGPGQISIPEFNNLLLKAGVPNDPPKPFTFTIDGDINWTSSDLGVVQTGIIDFRPESEDGKAVFNIAAHSSTDVQTAATKVSARGRLSNFKLVILKGVQVQFESVEYFVNADGSKGFSPNIKDVSFVGNLQFINNLKSALQSLAPDDSIKIDINPQRAEISQKISIPPATPGHEGGSFYLGPALIQNLYIKWGLVIPLLGQGELSYYFNLASREEPLTIFVPPYYGGKAHALVQATTRNLILFEVAAEFGGLMAANFFIASGEVSLTGGLMCQVAPNGSDLGAFSNLTGTLDVAHLVTFCGQIHIGLHDQGGGGSVAGEAYVTVSAKVGFFRVSLTFTASDKRDKAGPGQGARHVGNIVKHTNFKLEQAREPLLTKDSLTADMNFRPFHFITNEEWRTFIKEYA